MKRPTYQTAAANPADGSLVVNYKGVVIMVGFRNLVEELIEKGYLVAINKTCAKKYDQKYFLRSDVMNALLRYKEKNQ